MEFLKAPWSSDLVQEIFEMTGSLCVLREVCEETDSGGR